MTLMHVGMFEVLRSVLPEQKAIRIAVVFQEAFVEERHRHAGLVALLGSDATGPQSEVMRPKEAGTHLVALLWSAKGVMRVLVFITLVDVLLTCALVLKWLFG